MRRTFTALLAALLLFFLAGCVGTTTVEPGEGPAASAEPTEPTDPQVTEAEGEDHGPITEEPVDEPTEEPIDEPTEEAEAGPASFKEKYTYIDGLEVEVIKIENGKFTRKQVEYTEEKVGTPYSMFTVRLRNGSKATVDLLGSISVAYGPDGEQAESTSVIETDYFSGKLIPGKSRSGTAAFLIPPKYYGDVVMEVSPSFEHESAVFSGSIK